MKIFQTLVVVLFQFLCVWSETLMKILQKFQTQKQKFNPEHYFQLLVWGWIHPQREGGDQTTSFISQFLLFLVAAGNCDRWKNLCGQCEKFRCRMKVSQERRDWSCWNQSFFSSASLEGKLKLKPFNSECLSWKSTLGIRLFVRGICV